MFKNTQIYRLPAPYALTAAQLIEAIKPQSFTPCTASESLRMGWVPPREGGDLVYVVNKQMILMLRTEKKVLPSSVINQTVEAKAAEMEEAQGFAPGKKARKELKERVIDELMPRAFSTLSNLSVWIDPVNGLLVVDTPSPSKADDVIKLLLKAVDRMPVESLRVQRSPVAVMNAWLDTDEAPTGFTIDQNATLRATGESQASITYKLHTLDADDMRRHIAAGKQCVSLAMTWDDKISFTLTESLCIKSIKPLDVIKEGNSPKNEDERYDSNLTLMTGEYAKMIAELVEAMGGEATVGEPGGDDVKAVVGALHKIAATAGATVVLTAGVEPTDDELYAKAVIIVRTNDRASISLVQRHLHIGYNRAARLLDRMEKAGEVSAMQPDGNRIITPTK